MKILSSAGFKHFNGFINQGVSETLYLISFDSGNYIKATGDHRFLLNSKEWVTTDELELFDELFGGELVINIEQIKNQEVYDAYEVEDVHNYYTNGVISHNCNFLYVDEAAIIPNTVAEDFFTSTYPTISSGKTTKIVLTSTPLGYNHFWKFWNEATTLKKDKNETVNGFKAVEVKYDEHPDRDENWAQQQKELLGELRFNQEVMCLGPNIKLKVRDKFTKEEFTITVKELFNILESRSNLYK